MKHDLTLMRVSESRLPLWRLLVDGQGSDLYVSHEFREPGRPAAFHLLRSEEGVPRRAQDLPSLFSASTQDGIIAHIRAENLVARVEAQALGAPVLVLSPALVLSAPDNAVVSNLVLPTPVGRLSPTRTGPVSVYGKERAVSLAHAWMFARVPAVYLGENGRPLPAYWDWARAGWRGESGQQMLSLPPGSPVFWDGALLSEEEARADIFVPTYQAWVREQPAFAKLQALYARNDEAPLVLLDPAGFDPGAVGLSLKDAILDASRPFCPALVVGMMLQYGPDCRLDTLPAKVQPAVTVSSEKGKERATVRIRRRIRR